MTARQKRDTWRATWRDTAILFRQFRQPLILFTVAIFGGGLLYAMISRLVGEPVRSLAEAVYTILTAAFLQPIGGFPQSPYLQVFHFAMPIIGVIILAQGLADFGSLLFNRRARSKEWEMAIASTMDKHTILVGVGHLGYRVAQILHKMGENMVVIDRSPTSDTVSAVQKMDIPVIHDDATRPAALEAANVAKARTIILASQNDSMNLQIALKARSLNKNIQVIVRIFDEDFAHALHDQFGFTALSATEMAAPVFAAAAAGADVTNPISVEGQQLSLARMTVSPTSQLSEQTVGAAEDHYHMSIVLIRHDHQSEMHPTDKAVIHISDTLVVLGGPEELSHLMHENE